LFFEAPLAFLPIAIGIAILRYRLYDIDLVINKTLVYFSLAAFITLIYTGVVVGIGNLVGQGDEPNIALSLAATGLVAVAFQPVRERVQRVANRLVFGDRLSPYEAITSFSHKVSATLDPASLLKEMAEAASKGVGGERSRVKLLLPDGSSEEATWPQETSANSYDRTLEVTHQAEVVGEISVSKKKGEQLTRQDDALLQDLASQAGLAMRNLRLTEELRHKLIELQDSRKRIVAAQDTERRRMERDIHDGAQQQLVSMSVKLSLAKNLLSKDPQKAEGILDELKQETQEAVETLRDLARGLFPPILVDQGLVAAIGSHVNKSNLAAEIIDATAGARFSLETEANVYFVIREALQNASKHAPEAPITIRLEARADHLTFEVSDQGEGFDPLTAKASSGVTNMADRIEALGGTFDIESHPGRGTTIGGTVPAKVLETAH
jgi:signal transduction histidine kinase